MDALSAFPAFRRACIADQAAVALRRAIGQGLWSSILPGEYELARRLGISRPSVHTALSELARDGLVAISKGRRARVLANHQLVRPPPTVCVVRSASREMLGPAEHPVLLAMRAELAIQGVGWEEVLDARLSGKSPGHYLDQIVEGRRHMCWMMLIASEAVQGWFAAAGLPAMVLGSCFPGVRLPSVDVNYRAIGWHAASCISRLGHRHVAFVLPADLAPGDSACREGAGQYLRKSGTPISITDVVAGNSAPDVQAKLDRILTDRSRPTVIMTTRPSHTQSVLVHLLRSGLRIPEDISLVARDTDPLFELGTPELTRYRSTVAKQAHRAAEVARALLAGHPVSSKPVLITPTFIAGKTLARPPDLLAVPQAPSAA